MGVGVVKMLENHHLLVNSCTVKRVNSFYKYSLKSKLRTMSKNLKDLKECKGCKKLLSQKAKTCTNCGLPNPTKPANISTKGCLSIIIAIAFLVFVIKIMSNNTSDTTKPSRFWKNYDPIVKTRIDEIANSGNCQDLQSEFEAAYANDSGQRARVGEGNSELMGYIDSKLIEIGCHR